jgi:protein phosphatase
VDGLEKIEHACLTDVGVRRSHNQDNHAVLVGSDEAQWRTHGHLFVVADGMGGHAVGELASQQAVATIPHIYHKYARLGAVHALRVAYQEANANIFNKGQQNREFEGMGTTATTLLLKAEGAWIGHIGDTRVYRIRNGMIDQLTYDHSLAWEVARQRKVDPEAVQIPSNVLIRSLGPQAMAEVDIDGPHPVENGDIFLLCSDGLSGQVTDNEIGAVASALSPAEACRFLVDLANMRGGPDNVTVLIVRVGATCAEPAGATPPRSAKGAPGGRAWSTAWPLVALILGILLAAVASWLTYHRNGLGKPCYLVAAGVVIVGLLGLIIEHRHEKCQAVEAPRPTVKVHRQTACRIDREMVEKLARAADSLRQRAADLANDADRATYQGHADAGLKLLEGGEFQQSFREYCRAMRSVMEVFGRLKTKVEMFQPVWER